MLEEAERRISCISAGKELDDNGLTRLCRCPSTGEPIRVHQHECAFPLMHQWPSKRGKSIPDVRFPPTKKLNELNTRWGEHGALAGFPVDPTLQR